VGVCEVCDVDVVTDAGAVGRRIVGAENLDAVPLAQGRLQDQGDEVCFRCVVFTNGAASIGPGGIEVAQGHVAQAIGPAELGQHGFDHELGLAVDIGRMVGHVFGDRRLFRFAVNGGRRREDEVFDAGPAYSFQEAVRADDVVVVINCRVFHGFADLAMGGEVHDGVDVHVFHDVPYPVDVMDVDDVKRDFFRDGCPMAARKIINDDDVVALNQ